MPSRVKPAFSRQRASAVFSTSVEASMRLALVVANSQIGEEALGLRAEALAAGARRKLDAEHPRPGPRIRAVGDAMVLKGAEDRAVLEPFDEELGALVVAQLVVGPGVIGDRPPSDSEVVEAAAVALRIALEHPELRPGHESKPNPLADGGFAHRRSLQSRPCRTARSRS